jgi:hypothetical protein
VTRDRSVLGCTCRKEAAARSFRNASRARIARPKLPWRSYPPPECFMERDCATNAQAGSDPPTNIAAARSIRPKSTAGTKRPHGSASQAFDHDTCLLG